MWAGDPVFSPDQTQIIYQFNLIKWEDISQPKIYAHTPQKKFSNGYAPTLAIDPRAFLALARTDGSDAIHPIPIELPGQAVGYSWCQPDWHPYDRQKIAVSFLNAFPGYQDFTIYITNPEGTSIQSLLNPVNNPALIERHRSPAWSPDGNHIAYVRQVGNQYAIFIVRADGADSPGLQITPTNIVQLAPIPDIGTYFFDAIKEVCWSPDGNYLAFSVYSHANQQVPMGYDIYTTRRDGS
ncbi:MAG: TolB family protein, partial [bacterium]